MKRFVIFAAFFLSACATLNAPRPLSLRSFAVQCVAIRQVQCVIDKDMTPEMCAESVLPAINAINQAAGRELFHYAGQLHSVEEAKKAMERGVLFVGVEPGLPPTTLGVTLPKTTPESNEICIDQVAVLLSPVVWDPKHPAWPASVTTHELLHALGFAHAEDDGNPLLYRSIMMPAENSVGKSPTLSRADSNSLRAVYGR